VAGRGHRAQRGRDGVEELEGREQQLGTAVDVGFGEAVEEAALGSREGGGGVEGVQAFEREGRAGTVADEALDAGSVLSLDAHRRVDTEAAGALPCEHAGGVDVVQESVAAEVAKDPSAKGGLHVVDVIGRELGGLVKAHPSVLRCDGPPEAGSTLSKEPGPCARLAMGRGGRFGRVEVSWVTEIEAEGVPFRVRPFIAELRNAAAAAGPSFWALTPDASRESPMSLTKSYDGCASAR
jgi:hypothetical protein